MFAVAAVCFFLCPVIYDRPPLPTSAHALYRLIVNMDQPINCIPSLHAGMTVFAMLFAHRILAQEPTRVRRTLLSLGWIWTILILYGTLATKQHYFLDLPAGALLAWVSHTLAWRLPVLQPTSNPTF
jgi:membrane-associated phospholipid phosphatase